MPRAHPLFRELLRTFLADYLCLVDPDSSRHLWLDRIAFPDLSGLPGASTGDVPEVLAEIPARWASRDKAVVLVQVEPDALTPAELAHRLGHMFMDLEILYGEALVLNLLYVRGGRPGVNLETAPVCRVMGMEVLRLYYTAFGLETCHAEHYLDRPEPLAWALSTLMRPARHSRARHRDLCRQRVAASGLDAGRRELLDRFITEMAGEEQG